MAYVLLPLKVDDELRGRAALSSKVPVFAEGVLRRRSAHAKTLPRASGMLRLPQRGASRPIQPIVIAEPKPGG
ncbi:hypothetical protein AWC31_26050 [Mycolicibacterium wolinskyi]|uniref:Uncharacterized protein n=1 Tax=Mycolicibacterium wolinskyi TaxID=59750 RepID=A0A1X2F8A0_9MYCO|nr:hypothetical protein AWC31_26050 [Mycolicibacterium wolinskyi]